VLVVDAANVVGSRPTGWWRDRAGAASALVGTIRSALDDGALDGTVVVVVEGAARAGPAPSDAAGLRVVHAEGSGDEVVVELCRHTSPGPVRVVTADRELRRRAEALGADVVGPGWLYRQLLRRP
jgi:hypothetical protein